MALFLFFFELKIWVAQNSPPTSPPPKLCPSSSIISINQFHKLLFREFWLLSIYRPGVSQIETRYIEAALARRGDGIENPQRGNGSHFSFSLPSFFFFFFFKITAHSFWSQDTKNSWTGFLFENILFSLPLLFFLALCPSHTGRRRESGDQKKAKGKIWVHWCWCTNCS